MKKLFVTTMVLSFTLVGFAQTASFGVKGGATLANVKFSGGGVNISADSKVGFYGGLFAEIGVSESFAIQPEVLYSLLGSKSSDDTEDDKLDLSYISVPVLAKYITNGFSILAGPQFSFLASAKEKSSGVSEDIKDELKSTEIAGVIGAGYTLENGFGFDARYQFGLSNIAKDDPDFPDLSGTVKNNAFMLGIHYRFGKR